jgi:raffinose/stachyose/melibiose transport system permease protein
MLFTGLSVAILPMIILYLFMSKYFIKGMTAGAVKS